MCSPNNPGGFSRRLTKDKRVRVLQEAGVEDEDEAAAALFKRVTGGVDRKPDYFQLERKFFDAKIKAADLFNPANANARIPPKIKAAVEGAGYVAAEPLEGKMTGVLDAAAADLAAAVGN